VKGHDFTEEEVQQLLAGARAADALHGRLRSAFDPDLLAVRAVELAAGTDGTLLVDKPGVLRGFSFAETTGTARASLVLRDGFGDTGQIIAVLTLAAGESTRDWFGEGIAFSTGLYVDRRTGTTEGSVWVRTRQ
jgi:hypothetical protein